MKNSTSDARRKAVATRAANKAATAIAAAGGASPGSVCGHLLRPVRGNKHLWDVAEAAGLCITTHLDTRALSTLHEIMAAEGIDMGEAIGLALVAFRDGGTPR
ncbi:MAG: hypothetical protein M3Y55_14235 [Pseudomonadota bacterium]|nr:hypothetical protein [Pseudomonadota bacterium]